LADGYVCSSDRRAASEPAKAKQFHDVDLVSLKVAINAARDAGVAILSI